MPLILAIEPERQQAALLSSLVRGRLRAELVLADTTEQALVAIGDRVPDLVLIPALLSAQEDAALAGALRMIAAAANVQMLTIPLLAAPVPVAERLGVLAKWRRSKQAVPTAGCDPAVFAEQIAAYLADNGEPTTSHAVVESDAPAPVVAEALVEREAETSAVGAPVISDLVVEAVEEPVPGEVIFAGVEAPAGTATGVVTELIDEPIVHAVAQPLAGAAVEAPSLEALVVEGAEQLNVTEPLETLVAAEVVTALIREPAIEVVAASRVEQPTEAVVGCDETPIYELSLDELAGDEALMASIDAMTVTPGQETVVDVPVRPTPPAALVAPVVARVPAKPEWVELIESLRQDIERLKAERIVPMSAAAPREQGPAGIPPPDAGSPTPVVSSGHTPRRPFFPTKKAPRPVQDEWGLFDPDQCGFASLLAKLSEVTEGTGGRGDGAAKHIN